MHKYNNDIRKTWKVLNTITGRVSSRSTISETFMVNRVKSTDKTLIANEFCSYFTTIGKQYAEAIPKSNKGPSHYLGNKPNESTMYLFPHTNAGEISKIIKSFQTKKSTGDDGISRQLLKQLCQSCSSPVALIINVSLDQGIIPDAMKMAKVIPIFKAKIKESFNNYRPISLLSNISKVLEKVVHKRLYSFLTRCDILCDKQYGFRPNRSTIDAVTDLTSDVLSSLDRIDMCLSVYLDLSKAFDTINHKILLNKVLEYYGIRGSTLELFRSYLDRRMQYVCYNGLNSKIKPVEYGVPQGSVLGPLLFILYANDIPQCMSYCRTILFADDTTVYQVGKDPNTMHRQVNFDLKTLTDWFKANQLSVNPSKTKSILFKRSGYVNDINDYICIEN